MPTARGYTYLGCYLDTIIRAVSTSSGTKYVSYDTCKSEAKKAGYRY